MLVSIFNFIKDIRAGGLDPRFNLSFLLARSLDFPLIPAEDRHRHAEKNPQRVSGGLNSRPVLSVNLGPDSKVHFAQSLLLADIRQGPNLVVNQHLKVRPMLQRLGTKISQYYWDIRAPKFPSDIELRRGHSPAHKGL